MSSARAGLALFFSLMAVNVMAADWVVIKVTQPARYTDDRKTWHEVKRGMVLKNHSWLSTGNRARIVLQRNKDQVIFQPGTMAGLYERGNAVVHTDFAQQSGELRLSIDPRVKPHLAVQTPYMAALVKGTVFRVKVTDTGSSVAVERGRVQVSDVKSGETVGVTAGQKVTVDDDPETAMALSGSNKKFEQVITITPPGTVLQEAPPDQGDGKSGKTDKDGNKSDSPSKGSGTGSSNNEGGASNGSNSSSGNSSNAGSSDNGNNSSKSGSSEKDDSKDKDKDKEKEEDD